MDASPTPAGQRPDRLPADRCPRCGGTFRCGMGDPGPCACTRVRLDAGTLAELRRLHVGCLCLDCLVELAGSIEPPGSSGPVSRSIE